MAGLARPTQCSLAIAQLANHISGPRSGDSLDKPALMELVQVMGLLATESSQALLPRLDRASTLWKAEKAKLREEVLKGVQPPTLQITLQKAPMFSESLFPEKIFKECDSKYREMDNNTFFPALHRNGGFKRPLSSVAFDPTVRKRAKPSLYQANKGGRYKSQQIPSSAPEPSQAPGPSKAPAAPKGNKPPQGKPQQVSPMLKKARADAASLKKPFQPSAGKAHIKQAPNNQAPNKGNKQSNAARKAILLKQQKFPGQ